MFMGKKSEAILRYILILIFPIVSEHDTMHHQATLTTSSSTFASSSSGSSSGRSCRRSTRSFLAFCDGVNEVHQKGVSGGKFVSFRTGRRMNTSNNNAIGKGTKHIIITAKQEKDKLARDTIDLSKRKIGPGKEAPVKVTFSRRERFSVTVDQPHGSVRIRRRARSRFGTPIYLSRRNLRRVRGKMRLRSNRPIGYHGLRVHFRRG